MSRFLAEAELGYYDGKIKNYIDSEISDAVDTLPTTVTGNPVTFSDGIDSPARNVTVTVEPSQSGTGDPSPTNVRPLIGYSEVDIDVRGFNIWNEEWELGIIGRSGTPSPSSINIRSKYDLPISVKSATQYYMEKPAVAAEIFFYNKNKTFMSYITLNESSHMFTTPNDCAYIRFDLYKGYGATYNHDVCINLNKPTGTPRNGDYVPYNDKTITVQLGRTVYGGVLDVTNGKLTVTHGFSDLKTANWSYSDGIFSTNLGDSKTYQSGNLPNMFCSICPTGIYSVRASYSTITAFMVDTLQEFQIRYSGYTSVEDFVAFLTSNNAQLAYELATPEVIDLTPTEIDMLLGYNTISTNGTTLSLVYQPNNVLGVAEKYTDDKVKELSDSIDSIDEALAGKADTDDIPDLVSDNLAKGIFGNETVLSTDTVPFISKVMNAGKYQRKKFVGCSYVWNQLVDDTLAIGENTTFSNGVYRYTFTPTYGGTYNVINATSVKAPENHKCLVLYKPVSISGTDATFMIYTRNSDIPESDRFLSSTSFQKIFIGDVAGRMFLQIRCIKDEVYDTSFYYNVFDLTQLFGSTAIADYIYNLEQATAGAGIAKLKELGFFTEDYYAYDAGSVQSVDIKEYSVLGGGTNLFGGKAMIKNALSVHGENVTVNETNDTVALRSTLMNDRSVIATFDKWALPNTQYTFMLTYSNHVNETNLGLVYTDGTLYNIPRVPASEYESGKHVTTIFTSVPNKTISYLRGIWNNGISTLYADESGIFAKDTTEFEPYHVSTYPLTPTELRGVPKIDANNNIYCDGDEYASDGTKTEKYVLAVYDGSEDENWIKFTVGSASDFAMRMVLSNPTEPTNNIPDIMISNSLQVVSSNATWGNYDNFISILSTNRSSLITGIKTITTVEDWRTYLSTHPLAIVYKKATPTTETLTPFDYPQSVGSLEEIVDYKVEQEDRDVAIPTGHVTEYMGKGGEFTLPTLPTTPSVLAYDGHNFLWNKNVIDIVNVLATEIEAAWNGINHIMLPGRDLTVVFADEIANYSDEWAWIQARLNAHDVSGLRIGDYIPIKIAANGNIAAETHKAEIAGINTYRRTGDTGHEVGYHIDWITRDCYSGTVQFNTSNNNNGNESNNSPFLASNLKSWLDGTLYGLLDTKLKTVIKAKRIPAPYRYQSGATLTDDNSRDWQDFDKLWVPLECEIFDSLVCSTMGFGNGSAVQYPIFANSYEHRVKGAGPGGARTDWWTASARSNSSTHFVRVNIFGNSSGNSASSPLRVPVCFRTMEA